jgi:hypothetical protein
VFISPEIVYLKIGSLGSGRGKGVEIIRITFKKGVYFEAILLFFGAKRAL